MAPSKADKWVCEVLPPPRVETIHLVMDPRQLEPEIPCLMWTPDPPYVTGRLKLAMNLVYRSGMYLSQSTWPSLPRLQPQQINLPGWRIPPGLPVGLE